MDQTARTRRLAWIVLYVAVALAWAGLARWAVPPRLIAEHPGPAVDALKRFLHVPPAAFLRQDLPGRWRELSDAVLIAMALHLSIVMGLTRDDRRLVSEGAPAGPRTPTSLRIVLGVLAAAFLIVAAVAPARQDYYFYLEIWHQVREGHDPWFTVSGTNGTMPLNAYGPLFNLMAGLAWINPAAPRLLLSYAYIRFAVAMSPGLAAGRPPSKVRTLLWLAIVWSPFAWIEVAFYGHFDILVALACLGAVRAWDRGQDVRAGFCLAAGVLLKFLPIVLLPFLARDRERFRTRFLAATLSLIVIGLAASEVLWGPSTFSPLILASTRHSDGVSIFWFVRGPYSPLLRFGVSPLQDYLSPYAQLFGLGMLWWWSRARRPDVESIAVAVVLVVVLLYRVGFPQYQMVPFVLASAWLLRRGGVPGRSIAPVAAMTLYFGWIAAIDTVYLLYETDLIVGYWFPLRDTGGLPTFLLGSVLLGCIVHAATPRTPRPPHPPRATDHPEMTVESVSAPDRRRTEASP